MTTPSATKLWDANRAAIARFQDAIDVYQAWRGAQPPRSQWSGHQKLAGAGAHAALTQAAEVAFSALMTHERRSLFGTGFSFKVPALSRTNGHVSWHSHDHKTELFLCASQSVAFVWGIVLGLEESLTYPHHPVRQEWKAFDNGAPTTQFEIFVQDPIRGVATLRMAACDPVLATACIRAAIDGNVVDIPQEAQTAFMEGHAYGSKLAKSTFAWTAMPSWWKTAFSSPAGKRLHPSISCPTVGAKVFRTVDDALGALDTIRVAQPQAQCGIEKRSVSFEHETGVLRLAATLMPINAALCHAARLAKACGDPPKGPLALWIVEDASTAARPVKAWSGTSAILAHALAVLGRTNQHGTPTSMRLWKAWPATAEDGQEARSLAP